MSHNKNAPKQLKSCLKMPPPTTSNDAVVANGTAEVADKMLEDEHADFKVRQRRRSNVGINLATLPVGKPKSSSPNRRESTVSTKSGDSYSKYIYVCMCVCYHFVFI